MTIEAGARRDDPADERRFDISRPRVCAAGGRVRRRRGALESPHDRRLANFDRSVTYQAKDIAPQVTWGTNPGHKLPLLRPCPTPRRWKDDTESKMAAAALDYMGLKAGTPLTQVKLDRVFIGSCTNSRIEDLRAAAAAAKGHKVAGHVGAMVVPGSGRSEQQAEAEGLDKIFKDAGFERREAGCSMCLAMNPDKLEPGGNVARRPRIAISKADKAREAARIWCRPQWRPPPLVPVILSTFANGISKRKVTPPGITN